MSWLLKNWYIILIAVVIILWLIINPSATEQSNQVSVDPSAEVTTMEKEVTEEEKENEPVKELELKIDIKGEVNKPGVYIAKPEDRVQDVILLADGFTSEANQLSINLAEKVYDEMVIYVPNQSEEEEVAISSSTPPTQETGPQVKLNMASLEELQTIPGIGEVKAQAILEYRETNGSFQKVEDLTNVSGIGEKTLEKIKAFVQVP
ncbi:helix-hairpin-helix domain-containing protein [Gracilibacillus phocaeensis]|uniref:helix-hairpin-helix domain-containing protein n=1 Tax=Gracilibacillus phocaeensis TaxID=2042304 RepID=UPI0013EF375D|nr:helix-hairpin-helix domain-containing protein [Gracilibacillus phocaeensis]